MKTFDKFKAGYLITCFVTIYILSSLSEDKKVTKPFIGDTEQKIPNSPTSIMLYELIEKYSEHYDIPKYIAYNIAFMETRYRGPFHWKYNPFRESSAGAVGAMQIMPSTCTLINKKKYTKKELRENLELNCITSMKLLNRLYKKYKNWAVVCGCYNTGKPIINGYAKYCSSNLNYKKEWIELQH